MKIDRHGRAKILTVTEIQLLFAEGLTNSRDRALFGTCLYCACRIREACTLRTADAYERQGRVRSELIIRKGNTNIVERSGTTKAQGCRRSGAAPCWADV